MKLNKAIKNGKKAVKKVRPIRKLRQGMSYTEARETFLSMKPVEAEKIGFTAPKTFRPFFSVLAKENDLKYISFVLPDDDENAVFVVLAN